jgi:hypothetical protein
MAKIEINQTHLKVKLTLGEKILALSGDLSIPAALIRGAEVAHKDVWQTFGIRIGTGLPWYLVYGHFWWPSSKDGAIKGWTFALWRSKYPALTLNLATAKGQPYKRVVISTENAQELADTINDAILAC